MYVLLRPLIGLGHEVVVAAAAQAMHALVATGVWEPLIGWLRVDPIYSGAAIRALGAVQVEGFAVAGRPGDLLHALLPSMFLVSDQVTEGAGISMVAAAGAPALGRGLAAFCGDLVWLTIGLWLCARFGRRGWHWFALGACIQAQIVVNHLLYTPVSLSDLDASGIPFALQLVLPNGVWVTTILANLPPLMRDLATGSVLVACGYLCAMALLWGPAGLRRSVVWLRRRPRTRVHPAPFAGRSVVALTGGLAVLVALSPVGALAKGNANWKSAATPAMRALPHAASAGHGQGLSHLFRLSGATQVQIQPASSGTGWQYLVDGMPEVIRGVGYNPQYASLDPADRTAVYDRDFGAMHRLGVNTIEGWFETQFDSVTLDSAARNDIGVIMPFELNQDWPIEDPNVQQSILDHVSAYVEKYRNNPAVRMWAPGNENMHRVLYAHWVSQENDPKARARADAFAAFLPRLVDRIHELDPRHPVLYRDAEDRYLGRIASAFAQTGVERPWLVYGANVYSSPRLQQVVAQWPNQWPGQALVISEFAPGGAGQAQRGVGLQQQWAMIRSRPDVVLGGLAYTWATNGPEDLDRVFGFVDPSGTPTDGAVAALGAAYQSDGG
jgi:hypothetical protein